LTQDFFKGVINNLRTQVENNRELSEDLIEQQRKEQEASQAPRGPGLAFWCMLLRSVEERRKGEFRQR
jgi:hypothetical protein